MDRNVVDAIFRAAVERVDPDRIVQYCLSIDDDADTLVVATESVRHEIDLSRFRRIVVIGAGKATARMAKGAEAVLGSRLSEGVIAVKPGHTETLSIVESINAGHPVPNAGSVEAAKRITQLLERCDEETLVINLVSGGGSALLTAPADDSITIDAIQETTRLLLGSGAAIQEMNCVRKHLSAIKGGRLAARSNPATMISLILSDVVGDDLSSIASGMTVPDPTTYRDVAAILKRYAIADKVPATVARFIDGGVAGDREETPKEGDPLFQKITNVLIGTNAQALQAAAARAEAEGLHPLVLTSRLSGEAAEVARVFSAIAKDPPSLGADKPLCVIAGGETTVTLTGDGTGGRNQEMALAFLAEFLGAPEDLTGVVFLSGGTDGNDGPTDAAGGWADITSLSKALVEGIDLRDVLQRNDSYHALRQIGALYVTGPTNTNVCDVQILVVQQVVK